MLGGRFQADRRRQRLEEALKRYVRVGPDAEIQSDYARYLCVLASGYVEQTIYDLLHEYTRKRSNRSVLRHVERSLERFQNPSADKIVVLLGSFDAQLEQSFASFVAGERKEALNSIIATRHQIAHGESVVITYRRLVDLLVFVFEIMDWLVERLDPP